jgi:hypothetical protein
MYVFVRQRLPHGVVVLALSAQIDHTGAKHLALTRNFDKATEKRHIQFMMDDWRASFVGRR